ncbi:MAG: PEP-CTERM sorting domain-containing protein [Phycisphaeraceae bacterium]
MKRYVCSIALLAGVAGNAQAVNFDFEAPAFALGDTYGNPVGHVPGDVVFSQGGVDASVELFTLGGFVGFNYSRVSGHPGPPTSFFPAPINPTQSLTINNIAMNFDVTAAGAIRDVRFDYVDLGGDENLQINGFPRLEIGRMIDAVPLAPPGYSIAVSEVPIPGGVTGSVRITAGPNRFIQNVLVGGQEFGIDNFRIIQPGDTDGDGDIDDADLGTAFANYTGPLPPGKGGMTPADGDTDGDGDVDDSDLGTAFSGYTGPKAPAAAVPEPTSAALLLIGAAGLCRRRR